MGVLGTVAPGSLGGRIRNTRPATVVQPNTGGPPSAGFDADADPVVIGLSADGHSAVGAVSIGSYSQTLDDDCIAIGDAAYASGASGNIAIGVSADVRGNNNVGVGAGAHAGNGITGAVAVGGSANATADSAISIGNGANASADHTIAIGEGPTASSPHAIVIGQESTAAGFYSIAVGTFVYAAGQDSIAMGRSAEVDEDDGIAIGRRSWVQTGHTQSAAFGYNAQTSKPYQIMLGAAVGTSGTPYFVEIAGSGLVLKDSVTGTRYLLRVTSGALALSAAP